MEDTYWPIFSWKAICPSKIKLIVGKMNGLGWATLGEPCHKALNHQIISFMRQAHERIIANVPRVTKGKKCNGAIYKFWLVHTENFQPILFVILLLSIKYAPSHANARASYQNQYDHRAVSVAPAALLLLVQHSRLVVLNQGDVESQKRKHQHQLLNFFKLYLTCLRWWATPTALPVCSVITMIQWNSR